MTAKIFIRRLFVGVGIAVVTVLMHYLLMLGVAYLHTKYKIIDTTRYDIVSVKPQIHYWKSARKYSYMAVTVTAKPPVLGQDIPLYYSFAGKYIDVIDLTQFEKREDRGP